MLLIKNAHIRPMAGEDIANGEILIDGGKIAGIGVKVDAPEDAEIARAARIIAAAIDADWAPISEEGVLHDRASYRYFWQLLERAHQTGRALPQQAQAWFANPDSAPT